MTNKEIEEARGRVMGGDEPMSAPESGSLTIVGDPKELLRCFCHYRDALDYCLATLKHHHMTKRGISALVAKTEKIKDRANRCVYQKK